MKVCQTPKLFILCIVLIQRLHLTLSTVLFKGLSESDLVCLGQKTDRCRGRHLQYRLYSKLLIALLLFAL